MRSCGPSAWTNGSSATGSRSHPLPRPVSSPLSQESALEAALQTLDNAHSLCLLQSVALNSPHLLCLKTKLAHQLDQHHSCLQFCLQSLDANPACPSCLDVYLAHAHLASPTCPIRPKTIAALTEEGSPRALQFLLRLSEFGAGVGRYRRLMEELRRQRGQVQKFEVLEVEANERRIVAKSAIRRDEVILFVPKHKLITLELARTLPLVQRIYAARVHLKSPKHTQLAVYLMAELEKGPLSPFHSYLATLPTDFSRFPLNYPPELLQELQGTCFLEQVEAKKEDMRRDYELVCSLEESFARFPYQKFAEARLLVCSRVFGVVVERVKTDALVPLADMLNHHLPKQTSWYYCDSSKGFVIQSLREIAPGAEIFDSYGQKCNSRFLLHYGFTLPDNPHNEVTLFVSAPPTARTTTAPAPASTRLRVSRILESKAFEQLMGVLRAAANVRQSEDSEEEEDNLLENSKQTPFTSIEHEVRAWQLLEGILSERLREYPTTLAQDRRLLERAEGRLADVIVVRMGEKQVLQFYLTMARKVGKWLGAHNKRAELAGYEPYLSTLDLQGRTQQ